jgi:hypothetical protein
MRGNSVRQVQPKIEARIVAPVKILNDNQQRSILGQAKDKIRERVEKTAFFLLRLDRKNRRNVRKRRLKDRNPLDED